ncbi:ArnT family glycosyltransferase [Leuconostoc suionicum]|uniref:ArnT family glycosyltransferase n=1 Tax=Leuconostoc suionicum TaxID=1511761 RepID=UPI001B8D4C8D|nr:hypothetical protein [Leuconostoc suionicum]MBS1008531.1 hypothetical protein [Leuconostoc suionicum]
MNNFHTLFFKFLKKRQFYTWAGLIGIIFLYATLLLKDLGTLPGMFFDEANYASEVQSFATFGTDIHGLNNPVYLTSVWGQGQSILYMWLSYPIVKIFGFSIFNFRLSMVLTGLSLLSVITIVTRIISKNTLLTYTVSIFLVTSPWLFMSFRWVLDANIAPIILTLGVWILIYAFQKNIDSKLGKYFSYLGVFFIAISTYGYIAFWMYLPIFLLVLGIYSIKNNIASKKNALTYAFFIVLLVFPLIIFAVKVNVSHSNSVGRFLFFDIPNLPAGRSSSLVDFTQGNPAKIVFKNFLTGIKMYLSGNDSLPWNIVPGYGVVHPTLLIFSLFGLMVPSQQFNNFKHAVSITKLQFLSFFPLMFIVTPNFNHWNALNIPLVLLGSFGLYYLLYKIKNFHIKLTLLAIPVVLFIFFMQVYISPTSFSSSSLVNYKTVQKLNEKVRGHKLYIPSLNWNFAYFKLVKNVSPTYYKKYQDHLNADGLAPKYSFSNLRDISQIDKHIDKSDFILISPNETNVYDHKFKIKFMKNINFSNNYLILYQIK